MTEPTPDPNPSPPPDGSAQLAAIERERDEARDALAAARGSFATAMTALRDSLRTANPTLPPDLIAGDTVEDLTASVERARAVRDQVLAANQQTGNGHGHAPIPSVPRGGGVDTPPAPTTTIGRLSAGLADRRRAAGR